MAGLARSGLDLGASSKSPKSSGAGMVSAGGLELPHTRAMAIVSARGTAGVAAGRRGENRLCGWKQPEAATLGVRGLQPGSAAAGGAAVAPTRSRRGPNSSGFYPFKSRAPGGSRARNREPFG
mmetsp:Transcript_18900/g.72064  ORF Transcript_18900/g.72064 Transcript_18900/m.72064 type:complete len:123 (-) Transcript_18900:115-483(-)